MKTGHQRIAIDLIEMNTGQIAGLPSNPRQWTKAQLDKLKASIEETPELLEARGCIVDYHEGKYVCLGGNMRYAACKALGMSEVPCYVVPEETTILKKKEIVAKDNVSMGDWDFDALANEWSDMDLEGWGVAIPPEWGAACGTDNKELTEREEIERKKKEFEERIAAGEMREEDEEYQAFLAKFQDAKTTDDCYTPPNIYEAVVSFVVKTYGVKEKDFVRPFYPNGDYQNENYPHDCVVVDNPPFSILAEIISFFEKNKIKYFLFAPTLTLFSSSSSTALPIAAAVRYENGANVNTSFLTNLEPRNIRARSCPELYALMKKANEDNLRKQQKELPRYEYDKHVVTSTMVAQFSRYGIDFVVPRDESERIGGLDSQKKFGKGIFGSGFLISDRVKVEREKVEREKAEREKAEREKAEREKAEREKVERWELSQKELEIIARLNGVKK